MRNKQRLLGNLSLIYCVIGAVFICFQVGAKAPVVTMTFAEENPEETKAQRKLDSSLPKVSSKDWDLVLVNQDHAVPKDWKLQLENIDGKESDKRIIPSYQKMVSAAKKDNIDLVLVSAYRSKEYQQEVIDRTIKENENNGMSEEEAKSATMKLMRPAGHSEHNTGLSFDVVGLNYYNKNSNHLLVENFANDESAKWLAENARNYGFILRYPDGADKITNISFEPWHFRYVGVENAKYIEAHHLTLEEYIELLKRAGK